MEGTFRHFNEFLTVIGSEIERRVQYPSINAAKVANRLTRYRSYDSAVGTSLKVSKHFVVEKVYG